MKRNILVIQGHPDTSEQHLCHRLEKDYAKAAEAAGHHVRSIKVASLDIPTLHSKTDWQSGAAPPAASQVQADIHWAHHLVIIYPLWLGDMPALLKSFFEQVMRPGFAIETGSRFGWKRKLRGRSARIIVTMGMPAWVYRRFFRAHSLKSLARNILTFVGISPVRTTVIGMVENLKGRRLERCVRTIEKLGRKGI